MTNSTLFRESVKKAGIKYKALADILGITTYCLQNKIENRSEFKASEICLVSDALNLSDSNRNAIFFAKYSDL